MEKRQQVAEIIRAIRGCGVTTSEQVVDQMSDQLIDDILTADDDGKRRDVPRLISDAAAPTPVTPEPDDE